VENSSQNIIKSAIARGIQSGSLAGNITQKRIENLLLKLAFSFVFVVLMWISSNSFFYMPFTPIPVTMQVLTVLVSALTLGGYWAAFSMMEYVFLGLIGAPVFAGFKNGFTAIQGPTGGFIIGYIAAAFGAGLLFRFMLKRHEQQIRSSAGNNIFFAFLSSLAGIFIIYSFGYFHFAGYFSLLSSQTAIYSVLMTAFKLAVAPFIIFDLIKVLIIILIYRFALYEKNQDK
jgi:biotin transport system substrate-specific component